jgi:hypothetical protein
MTVTRVPWQAQLGVVQTTVGIANQPSFELGSGLIGLNVNTYGLSVFDVPDILEYPGIRASDLATNRPDMSISTTLTGEYPSTVRNFNVTMECTPSALALFGWLLFQNGATQFTSGGLFRQLFSRYTSSDCEVWAAFVRVNTKTQGVAENHVALGCVCRTLRLIGSEGGVWVLSADMLAADVVDDMAWSFSPNNALGYMDDPTMPFSDSSFLVGSNGIPMLAAEIVFTNSAFPQFWQSPNPYRWQLGQLRGELRVRIPWDGGGSFGVPYWKNVWDQQSFAVESGPPIFNIKSGAVLGSGALFGGSKLLRVGIAEEQEEVGDIDFALTGPSFDVYETTNRGIP